MLLKDRKENYVKDHYPVADWEVEILTGSDHLGCLVEAKKMAEEATVCVRTSGQDLRAPRITLEDPVLMA